MSQPIQVLRSSSRTSTVSLRSEKGLYIFRGSLECSSLNMVCMTNKAAFLARSTQHGSEMVMVIMSLMNPSIEASFDSILIARWYALTSESEAGRYSSLGSKCILGNWRLSAPHGASARRSFPRLIAASLMVLYSSGTGVVPNARHSYIKDIFPTIAMHVDNICAFAWMCRYAALRSIFPIRMRFDGHFVHMYAIMWSILRRKNS